MTWRFVLRSLPDFVSKLKRVQHRCASELDSVCSVCDEGTIRRSTPSYLAGNLSDVFSKQGYCIGKGIKGLTPLSAFLYCFFFDSRPSLSSQTFLLKVVSTNADGSASIIKSVPCSAGSATELCMVEVRCFVPDEDMDIGQKSCPL